MVHLSSPELDKITKFLGKYDLKSTVSKLAGLLTAPSFQANTIRIEILVYLAVTYCRGNRKPGITEIRNWLNRQLAKTDILRLEDPVEDVFVTNVETPEGNRRVFEGIWESNDRCQPWRAKRRLVDPSSREAALFSRRALRQRENKVGLRTWRPVIGSQVRSSNELAKLLRSAW